MSRKFVSPKELRAAHPDKKRKVDFYKNFWAHLFVRPASYYLAPLFLYFRISANQVTAIGTVLLLVALGLIGTASSYSMLIVGAVLINVWFILDYVDGVVARHNATESKYGEFIDWLSGLIERTFLPIVIAVFLFRIPEAASLTVYVDIQPEFWLLLAFSDVISRLLRRVIQYKIADLTEVETTDSSISVGKVEFAAHTFRSFKRPLLVVFAILAAVDVWLVLYAVYSIAILIPATFREAKIISPAETASVKK